MTPFTCDQISEITAVIGLLGTDDSTKSVLEAEPPLLGSDGGNAMARNPLSELYNIGLFSVLFNSGNYERDHARDHALQTVRRAAVIGKV